MVALLENTPQAVRKCWTKTEIMQRRKSHPCHLQSSVYRFVVLLATFTPSRTESFERFQHENIETQIINYSKLLFCYLFPLFYFFLYFCNILQCFLNAFGSSTFFCISHVEQSVLSDSLVIVVVLLTYRLYGNVAISISYNEQQTAESEGGTNNRRKNFMSWMHFFGIGSFGAAHSCVMRTWWTFHSDSYESSSRLFVVCCYFILKAHYMRYYDTICRIRATDEWKTIKTWLMAIEFLETGFMRWRIWTSHIFIMNDTFLT